MSHVIDRMATRGIERLLASVGDCLTPEVAERLVALRAEPDVQARIDELADLANHGRLTQDEREEYEAYVRTITFISLLQARAKRLLNGQRKP